MNIGIYGTSIALYNNDEPDHFITLIKEHYNARIVHTGIVQCSEERILFNLKKTKKLDLAIIFHAPPYNIFVPSWNRDITSVDKDTFNKKISVKEWIIDLGLSSDQDIINQFSEFFETIPNKKKHCSLMFEHFKNKKHVPPAFAQFRATRCTVFAQQPLILLMLWNNRFLLMSMSFFWYLISGI